MQPIQASSPPASLRATPLAPLSVLGRAQQIVIRRGPSHRTSRFHSEPQIASESSEHELEGAEIRPLKEVEQEAILVAVKRLGVHGAAAALGIGKTTIHRKLRDYQKHDAEPEGDGGLFLSQK